MVKNILWGARIVWPAPWTLIGFMVGVIGVLTGGGGRRVGRALEFWGGTTKWLLEHATPLPHGAAAMTIGHVILGTTPAALDRCRGHEWIHVGQYERWGVMFVPAYLGCSAWLWLRGKDAYRDNPFEREAFGHADLG